MKTKNEGKVYDLTTNETTQKVFEVNKETNDTKIDDNISFEEFKIQYEGKIKEKCLADYGTDTDEDLLKDTAKEMYLSIQNYLPDGDTKTEGELNTDLTEKTESKQLKESMPDDWYDKAYSKYVPESGNANTNEGEILRTFSIISHMFLNNGDKIWRGNYANNSQVLDPVANKLYDLLPQEGKELMEKMANSTTLNAYEKRLNTLEDYIYNYLKDKVELDESKQLNEERYYYGEVENVKDQIKSLCNNLVDINNFIKENIISDEDSNENEYSDEQKETLNQLVLYFETEYKNFTKVINNLSKVFPSRIRTLTPEERDYINKNKKESKQLKEGANENLTYEQIIEKMANATDYSELYDAASEIKNTDVRVDVENLIGECEDDETPVDETYSIVATDVLDMYVNEENVEKLNEDQYENERRRGVPPVKRIAEMEYYDNEEWYKKHIKDYKDITDFVNKEIAGISSEYNLKDTKAEEVCKEVYKLAIEDDKDKKEESTESVEYKDFTGDMEEIEKALNNVQQPKNNDASDVLTNLKDYMNKLWIEKEQNSFGIKYAENKEIKTESEHNLISKYQDRFEQYRDVILEMGLSKEDFIDMVTTEDDHEIAKAENITNEEEAELLGQIYDLLV